MTIISLKNFVQTGQFGPVTIGMTKDEVINLLGEPEFDNDYHTGSGGLVYAWYEFFYWQDSLKMNGIQNDHLRTWPGNKRKKTQIHQEAICFRNDKISIDIWFLKPGQDITYCEVIKILRDEQIQFEEVNDPYQGYLITFESGVKMDFVNGESHFQQNENIVISPDNQLLNGIRLFDYSFS